MTAAAIYTKQFRLAQHYLHKLRKAHHAYSQGDSSAIYGLKLVEQDWAQIQQGYSWSVTLSKQQDEVASLCSAYPYEAGELLELLLTPQEQYDWRKNALAAAQQIGDQQAELAHLLALGDACMVLAHYGQGMDYAQQAWQLAERLDNQTRLAEALVLLGNLEHIQEHHTQAIEYLEQSLSYFHVLDNQKGLAKTYLLLGHVMHVSNDLTSGDEYYRQAVHFYRQVADPRGVALAQLALAMSPLGGPEKLDQLASKIAEDEYLRVFEKMGDRLGLAHMLQHFGFVRYHAGNLAAGTEYWLKSLQITRQLGAISHSAFTLLNLGIDAAIQNNYPKALEYLTESDDLFRKLKNEPKIAHVAAMLVITYSGLDDAENARKFLGEALPRARHLNYQFLMSLSLTGAVTYRLITDDPEGAAVLMGVVDNYPYTTWDIKEYALSKLRLLAENIRDPAAVEAAFQHGRQLDFDTVVADLIVELQSSGKEDQSS